MSGGTLRAYMDRLILIHGLTEPQAERYALDALETGFAPPAPGQRWMAKPDAERLRPANEIIIKKIGFADDDFEDAYIEAEDSGLTMSVEFLTENYVCVEVSA